HRCRLLHNPASLSSPAACPLCGCAVCPGCLRAQPWARPVWPSRASLRPRIEEISDVPSSPHRKLLKSVKNLGYSISTAFLGDKRGLSMNLIRRLLALAVLPALLLTGPAFCQNVNGTFTGIVTDATGAVAPNASVTARNTGTSATFATHSDGEGVYWI